ncbi:MAG TPA: hypothetical protein VMI06_02590, partial [Terriglobia bacterium]|nr:hypothetical protein [Terriglobia bacterium]
ARNVNDLDPRRINVRFSENMQTAFADLEAAVHFSEQFDGDMRETLREWAVGKKPSIYEVLTAMPLIAEETFNHIRATGDAKAKEAWSEVCLKMSEQGFTLAKEQSRGK